MLRIFFRSNLNGDMSKVRIIKNLIVISLAFLFLTLGDEGLLMLQTSMNKEGVGTATLAIHFVTYALTSLLFSSFFVKKLGSKNAQILGIIIILPFIASNVYPMWITMLLSAVLSGIGKCLLWTAQCTYFNESSVLYCKMENNRRKSRDTCNVASKQEGSNVDKQMTTFKSDEQKVEQLSAFDLLKTPGNLHSPASNKNSTIYQEDASPIRLTAYRCKKDDISERKILSKEKNTETMGDIKRHNLETFNESDVSKTLNNVANERNEEIFLDAAPVNVQESKETAKYRSNVDSTKAFFFGIHGLAYHSAAIWSCLVSYYILETAGKENYNKITNYTCGAKFCSTNKDGLNNNMEEVPDDTRHLLIGVCMACAIVAPLLMLLFLDRMVKTTKNVKLSWEHVFATVKYIKKKDQLLLIPFTIGSSLCRGFYMADFTKSYIACAWSISHIGLITIIHGATSALSSISSGVVIKYVGRIPVLVLCQIIAIANFVFLFFWNPDAQQPHMFYVQGGIFGMISGIYNSQVKAFYGVLFEGDEATAFSSCNLYNSIGWALSFIYNDFLCVSVKIYIVLAFSCTGFLGYLLAERSYSMRSKHISTSK